MLAASAFSGVAYADMNHACWTSPTLKVIADLSQSTLKSNKKGARGSVNYQASPASFSGICNRYAPDLNYNYMDHYVDLGPNLQPSSINAGWYRLNDDVDIKIWADSTIANYVLIPTTPDNGLLATAKPPSGCYECVINGFSVAGSGLIELMLRRDVIGGAIIFPANEKLFTAYRVASVSPRLPKPEKPMIELYTSGNGSVIPIPSICEINRGNTIYADFGFLDESKIGASVGQSEKSVDLALTVSCNTSLTQDARIRLMTEKTTFSDELIKTSNAGLGIAMSHKGKLIKPFGTFPLQLFGGSGSETITLTPVRNPQVTLQEGKFSASATLIVESQ
ncbi:fimbrial protein [Serratia nematodiphila]|nr:fimbrial protein [Serratia nematodiphila]